MGTFRFGKILGMRDPNDDNALAELRQQVVDEKSFGTAAPTSATPGSIYFRHDADNPTTTALKVYIKDPTTKAWWGA